MGRRVGGLRQIEISSTMFLITGFLICGTVAGAFAHSVQIPCVESGQGISVCRGGHCPPRAQLAITSSGSFLSGTASGEEVNFVGPNSWHHSPCSHSCTSLIYTSVTSIPSAETPMYFRFVTLFSNFTYFDGILGHHAGLGRPASVLPPAEAIAPGFS